jgi:hypothetical protein
MDESAELNENQTKIKLTTIIEMNAGILSWRKRIFSFYMKVLDSNFFLMIEKAHIAFSVYSFILIIDFEEVNPNHFDFDISFKNTSLKVIFRKCRCYYFDCLLWCWLRCWLFVKKLLMIKDWWLSIGQKYRKKHHNKFTLIIQNK